MAIARSSPIIGAISGPLASTIFRNTRNGLVLAQRPLRISSQSQVSLFNRAKFAAIQASWISLTADKRATWTSAARTITYPNRLGIPQKISPWNLYVLINSLFYENIGINFWWFNTTCNGIQIAPPSSFTFSASKSGAFTTTSPDPLDGRVLTFEILFLSAACSPGQTYQPNRWNRIGIEPRYDQTIVWTTKAAPFMAQCYAGQTIGARVVWVDHKSIPSAPRWLTANVTA